MQRRMWMVCKWMILLTALSGAVVGCAPANPATMVAFTQDASDPVVGSEVSAFGVVPTQQSGVARFDDQMLVRWETLHDTPVVTAIAEGWTAQEQQQFLSSGDPLLTLADQFVQVWAPADTSFVAENRRGVGGTALFAYRSETVRSLLRAQNSARSDAGELYVVVVLDSTYEETEVPIVAADFASQADLESALFTVALVVGRPWSEQTR